MKFKDLLRVFKDGSKDNTSPGHIRSHMKNLLEIAMVDGHFDDSEFDLLKKLAQKYDISEDELTSIRDNPSDIEFEIPEDDSEKFEQFYELIQMMMADNKIYEEEMNLCIIFGRKFGYNNVRRSTEAIVQYIKDGVNMESTMNNVDYLLH